MGGSSAWSYWTDYLPWELRSNAGESHMVAALGAPGMWQRMAKCHMVHDDVPRSSKVVNSSLPRIISTCQTDACHPRGYSYYWSNTCFSPETKLGSQGEFSPKMRKDFHSEFDESWNARFSKPTGLQSLATETTSVMKSGRGLINTCDYCAAELELEWQFVIDPRPKSGLTDSMSELGKEEGDVTFEEAVWCDAKHDGLERVQQDPCSQFETSEMTSKRNCDVESHGSHYGGFRRRGKLCASNVGAVSEEMSEEKDRSSRSSMKSLLWQETEERNSATQSQVECSENCSFCCPKGRVPTKVATMSLNHSPATEDQPNVLQNIDTKIFSSLPCGHEFKHFKSTSNWAFSPGFDDLDPSLSDPQTKHSVNGISIRHRLQSLSSSNKNSQFSAGSVVALDQSSVLLAEALCHSQTRAREAEKKVQRVFEEKERLMRLFFKEAYLAFTYRQWVSSLQSENMWLKMSPQHQPVAWLHHSVFNPFLALEKLSSKHWKTSGHYCSRCNRDQNLSDVWHEKALVYLGNPNEMMMGYTLAFALGLSLAGAGLVLGWSMGWILLS